MDVQYAFRINPELLEKLREIAKSQDMSLSQLFRKLARECVASETTTKGE